MSKILNSLFPQQIGMSEFGISTKRQYTVKPVLSGPVLNGHPLLNTKRRYKSVLRDINQEIN